MSSGERLARADAVKLAERVVDEIDGETIVAGSIRRGLPTVGDVEILVHRDAVVRLPVGSGLFASDYESLVGGGAKWKLWRLRHRETSAIVDLYRFDDLNRGSILLIRTGPASFSKRWVTELREHGYAHKDGYVRNEKGRVVECPNETTAFYLTNWPEIRPQERR